MTMATKLLKDWKINMLLYWKRQRIRRSNKNILQGYAMSCWQTVAKMCLWALVFFLSTAPAMADEAIRQKIETLGTEPILSNRFPVHCVSDLKKLYLEDAFEPIWTDAGSVGELMQVISDARYDGLNPDDYHMDDLQTLSAQRETREIAADRDILMTDALLLYASHLTDGKVDPQTLNAQWYVTKSSGKHLDLLRAEKTTLSERIDELRPKDPLYTGLKTKLKRYMQLGASAQMPRVAHGPLIRPGMSDPRIVSIRKILWILEDLPHEPMGNNPWYDDELQSTIITFQKRQGLAADGIIGRATIDALSLSIDQRIRQIRGNMERFRWLPDSLGPYYLFVNIPDFSLTVIKNGRTISTHRVIVGKSYRKTPVFASRLEYMVFNPTWTVPPTILLKDVLPSVKKDPGYLKSKRIRVFRRDGAEVDPETIDWNSPSAKSLVFREDPGDDNSLGKVKFMFPNRYDVYLHDTPSRTLFDKTERAFSSGCIRVQNPLDLAVILLNDPVKWGRPQVDAMVAAKATRTVFISEKPMVYILYFTVWTDENGTVNFRKDIYDRDERLYRALEEPPR